MDFKPELAWILFQISSSQKESSSFVFDDLSMDYCFCLISVFQKNNSSMKGHFTSALQKNNLNFVWVSCITGCSYNKNPLPRTPERMPLARTWCPFCVPNAPPGAWHRGSVCSVEYFKCHNIGLVEVRFESRNRFRSSYILQKSFPP